MLTKEQKDQWLAALRSGDYTQGTGFLRTQTAAGLEHCCLGVLCEAVLGSDIRGEDGCTDDTDPPELVAAIPEEARRELAALNDDGVSFSALADVIECSDLSSARSVNVATAATLPKEDLL